MKVLEDKSNLIQKDTRVEAIKMGSWVESYDNLSKSNKWLILLTINLILPFTLGLYGLISYFIWYYFFILSAKQEYKMVLTCDVYDGENNLIVSDYKTTVLRYDSNISEYGGVILKNNMYKVFLSVICYIITYFSYVFMIQRFT